MIRTQIQITPEQARALKRLAAKEGKSVAELIRLSLDDMLRAGGIKDQADLRRKARAAAARIIEPGDHLLPALLPDGAEGVGAALAFGVSQPGVQEVARPVAIDPDRNPRGFAGQRRDRGQLRRHNGATMPIRTRTKLSGSSLIVLKR